MKTTVATIAATLITIMALAQYHYSLAEYPTVGIILANERLKENVVRHNSIVISFYILYRIKYDYNRATSASMCSGVKRIAFSTTFSNTFCNLSISPRRSLTILPGFCSTQSAFSGTSFLA